MPYVRPAFTRQQAVDEIKQGLSFRKSLDNEIVRFLDKAQREFEGDTTLPWFLETEPTVVDLVGSSEWALPEDFIREIEDEPFRDSTSGLEYEKLPYTQLANGNAVLRYAIRARSARFWPTEHQHSVLVTYYARQSQASQIGAGGTNAWLSEWPDGLTARAGMFAAEDIKDGEARAKFAERYAVAERWLVGRIVERETANRRPRIRQFTWGMQA